MTSVFALIGENRDDPYSWLVIGDDGQQYRYQLPGRTTTPVAPDASWVIDPHPPPLDELLS
jgi:hypothetical protein